MSDFVPSYSNEEERLKIRKEKDRKDRIRMTIITVIVVLVICIIGFVSYTLANRKYSLYEPYKNKMEIYGFAQVYDDGDAKTKDKVTKSEAIKMILSCVYNVQDIEGIAMATDKEYENAIWVEFAIKQGIVSDIEINEDTANDKVKYKEVLVWLYNVKAKILNIEPNTEVVEKIKDINAYNADQKLAIYDLINSNVIRENPKYIDGNKKLYKGKLNELIVNFSEVYNTITVGDAKININPEKIPSNEAIYPYTLASVQKDVYELPLINENGEGYISPVELYKDNKQFYSQIKNYVESYYGYLINVDYEKISKEQMNRKMKKYALNELTQSELEKYATYVKDNKIKLEGKATVELPCIYFDGQNYRVRTKLEFEVKSANTDKDLLYLDKNTTYSDKMYSIYVDVIMTRNETSKTLFIEERAISTMLSKKSNGIVRVGD